MKRNKHTIGDALAVGSLIAILTLTGGCHRFSDAAQSREPVQSMESSTSVSDRDFPQGQWEIGPGAHFHYPLIRGVKCTVNNHLARVSVWHSGDGIRGIELFELTHNGGIRSVGELGYKVGSRVSIDLEPNETVTTIRYRIDGGRVVGVWFGIVELDYGPNPGQYPGNPRQQTVGRLGGEGHDIHFDVIQAMYTAYPYSEVVGLNATMDSHRQYLTGLGVTRQRTPLLLQDRLGALPREAIRQGPTATDGNIRNMQLVAGRRKRVYAVRVWSERDKSHINGVAFVGEGGEEVLVGIPEGILETFEIDPNQAIWSVKGFINPDGYLQKLAVEVRGVPRWGQTPGQNTGKVFRTGFPDNDNWSFRYQTTHSSVEPMAEILGMGGVFDDDGVRGLGFLYFPAPNYIFDPRGVDSDSQIESGVIELRD